MSNYISIFDLFKIGIGPSSSHTVGPMVAANRFISELPVKLNEIKDIKVELYGSLAHTGYGHKINTAIMMGLYGTRPSEVENSKMIKVIKSIYDSNKLLLNNSHSITFDPNKSIIYNKEKTYKFHSNAIEFTSTSNKNKKFSTLYYSVGGGFIVNDEFKNFSITHNSKYNYDTANQLLQICNENNKNIYDIVLENEYLNDEELNVKKKILYIVDVMNEIIRNGIKQSGPIDSILNLQRRAKSLYSKIKAKNAYDPLEVLDWVNLFAISTCEENASGNRIVTAPTNGAAGIIPAVVRYYQKFIQDSNDNGVINFIATSSAIGSLFKKNASLSGAEVGCQGEVGVACSMAAAGLTAALGGNYKQIENAAEIAMEHNLGLTCDPVKGLVQIPCIERNSMGAIKAINASRLALNNSNTPKVSLDQVIKTMNDTGRSMSTIYKETSLGGLAVNVIEC
ncbi:L-serine ammonia-lyase [Candidatus Marinimicrobia bacterium]|nr:L-serine ammonia-lyase [Candidatus Neomarinimicrobiota bacterium]